MNLKKQQQRFQENWLKHAPNFGSKDWESSPDFEYAIDLRFDAATNKQLEHSRETLKKSVDFLDGTWKKTFHITLALPARGGSHFQGNEEHFMQQKLSKIIASCSGLDLEIGDWNCFPDVLFREVYDRDGGLYELHKAICKTIPFAQAPDYQIEGFLPHVSMLYGPENPHDLFLEKQFDRTAAPLSLKQTTFVLSRVRDDQGKFHRQELHSFEITS